MLLFTENFSGVAGNCPTGKGGPSATRGTPATGAVSFEPDIDLERATARLAPRQRLAVELHYFVGLGVTEAAQNRALRRVASCGCS